MATSQAPPSLNYEQTLMYGKYKEDLAASAKREGERLQVLRNQQQIKQQQEQQRQKQRDDAAAAAVASTLAGNAAAAVDVGSPPPQKEKFSAWDCWYGCVATLRHCRMFFFRYVGEDWFFLAMLGIIMACVSFVIDSCIEFCHEAHDWLYEVLEHKSPALQVSLVDLAID